MKEEEKDTHVREKPLKPNNLSMGHGTTTTDCFMLFQEIRKTQKTDVDLRSAYTQRIKDEAKERNKH